MTTVITSPAIDLSSCDKEPIHILGHIQPHGVMFACPSGQRQIAYASSNTGQWPGQVAGELAGKTIDEILSPAVARKLDETLERVSKRPGLSARLFSLSIPGAAELWDACAHDHDGMRLYELEPANEALPADPLDLVRAILHQLQQTKSLRELCDQTVHLLRDMIGFDRVMIYRFLEDGAGHVIAESQAAGIEPLINLRYPASDIPVQARELYKKSWIRLISDVHSAPCPIFPAAGFERRPLDLSYAALRSVSPVHIEYLRNMKVGASMSISIIAGGELWGLIGCHHATGKLVASNIRAAAELLGQVFSLQIQTVEGIEAYVTMRAARAMLDRIVAEFPVEGNLIDNLAQRLEPLSAFINSDGVGIWLDGIWRSFGLTPPLTEVSQLAAFVDTQGGSSVYATQRLGEAYPRSRDWPTGIAGLLAIPLSHTRGDLLMFFRREVAQTVTWGGNPEKPAIQSAIEQRISPRKSFEAWKEEVRGKSLPWTSRERLIADTLRVYLLDVIVRFSEVILDERRKSQQRARALTSELNHHVKGTLDLIQSLVARGQDETSLPDFVRTLQGRIGAISLAHAAIASAQGADVGQLIKSAMAAQSVVPEQISASGPNIWLDAKAFTALALVIHELTCNAIGFGALAVPNGHIAIRWSRDSSGRLVLSWEEAGGPPVRAGSQDRLGLSIIRRNIPHSLGGEADVQLDRSGLKARFVIPPRFIVADDTAALPDLAAHQSSDTDKPLEGFSLLVLDDQMLTAMDLQRALLQRGATTVEISGTIEKALELILLAAPDAALLDIDLDDTTSFALADELERLSIPFIFMGSDVERRLIPRHLQAAPFVFKPCDPTTVSEALRDVLMPQLIRAVLAGLL